MDTESIAAPDSDREWMTKLGVKFYRYRALIRRRWWLLALTISLGLAYEGWMVFTAPIQYQSTGRLMVSPRLNFPEGSQYQEEQQNFYGTQLQILQNDEIQERARRRLALEAPQLAGTVEAVPNLSPRTSIFNIVGIGSSPEYTQRFVDAVMEEFIAYKREKLRDTTDSTMVQISEELQRLRKDKDQHEKELQAFIEKNNMAFWDEQSKTASRYLSELKTQQANLTTELHRLQNLTSEQLLTRSATKPAPQTEDTSGTGTDTPISSDLNVQYLQKSQELVQKQAEFEEMSKIWKPKHPRLIALQDDIEKVKRLITTIKNQTQETTQSRIAAISAESASLDSSIRTWEEKVLEASRKDAEYQRLQNTLARTQNLYEKLLLSIQTLDVGKSVNQETLTIMQKANQATEVPLHAVQRLLTGFAVGLVLGVLLLVVLDRADDRFSSSTEVIEKFSESILGQIPDVSSSAKGGQVPLLQKEDERYMYAEAFRSLRSSLIFMPNQGELKTLMVTSAIPSEGKSTIASNLAVTMVLAGARVLLVDADLRRGDLAHLFETDGQHGLSSVLRGEMPWRSVAQQTKYPTLTLLTRGPVTNQSSELLLLPLMDSLLAEWKREFDLVVFNASPILATDDTATLAPNFDGTLMVIRAQFTPARLLRNSLNALYQRQVNVLGLILNRIDTETPDYYYYQYPKYYAA